VNYVSNDIRGYNSWIGESGGTLKKSLLAAVLDNGPSGASDLVVVLIIIFVLVVVLLFLVRVLLDGGSLALLGRRAGGLALCLFALVDVDLLLVTGLVFGGQRFVLGLLGIGVAVPATAQLLGDVADRAVGHDRLHLGSLIVAEPEKGRQGPFRGIGVLHALSLLALLALWRLVGRHFIVVPFLVLLGHVMEALLFLVGHGLPAVGTFAREFGKDHTFIGMFLLVLFTAGLHEIRIG